MSRVTVVGARGMLGRALCRELEALGLGAETSALDLPELDITSAASVADRGLSSSEVVFNCAAYTNVERAEAEEAQATRVNGDGVRLLARALRPTGGLLVHVSTDYVFDGEGRAPYPTDHPRRPLSAYGRSKLAGELALEEEGPRFALVRTAWLFGLGGANFVETMLRLARERGRLEVVDDQLGSPTMTVDLARAMIGLWRSGATGTFHCTGAGVTSWHGFASEIVRQAGIDVPVLPLTTEESVRRFGFKARRPRYSALDCSSTEAAIGRPLRPWPAALADYLSSRP